jgi:hypothetical protein
VPVSLSPAGTQRNVRSLLTTEAVMPARDHALVDSGSAQRWKLPIRGLGAAALFAAALAIPAADSAAAPACGPRSELLKQLSQRYSEAPVAVGLASDGSLIELLTSGNGASWTLIVSQPHGPSCLIAAGESWQSLKQVAAGDLGI